MKKVKKFFISFLVVLTLFGAMNSVSAYYYNLDKSGGQWSYGVGTKLNLWFRQESKYYHGSKSHYANAMMNDTYTGRVKAAKGKWANAYTKYYFAGWKTNRSYYGFN